MDTPAQYIIRDFQVEDYPALLSLWERTGMATAARADDLEVIQRTLAMGGKLFVMIAYGEENVIGSSWITHDGRRLYLHHFAVEPGLHGLGLGRKLLAHSLLWARSTGMQIKLEVHRNNIRALNLYEKNGFSYLGDYKVYIIRDYSNI